MHSSLLTHCGSVCACDAGWPCRMLRRARAAASLADRCSTLLRNTSTVIRKATRPQGCASVVADVCLFYGACVMHMGVTRIARHVFGLVYVHVRICKTDMCKLQKAFTAKTTWKMRHSAGRMALSAPHARRHTAPSAIRKTKARGLERNPLPSNCSSSEDS